MKKVRNKSDSRQFEESDYRSKNDDLVLRLWNSALQYLLPVAGLAMIWGKRGLFTRFLLQFHKNCISELYSSLKRQHQFFKWVSYYIPVKWVFYKNTSLSTTAFWKDGSLLCSLINTVFPGACYNPHRHRRQPPSHGQALAYKYLGIAPVFTENDFTMRNPTEQHEKILFEYIENVQNAVKKASRQDLQFSFQYVAKGMGLVSGEQNRKMDFYIYLNTSTYININDVIISIQAPHNTYHTLSIPSRDIKQKFLPKNFISKSFNETKIRRSFFKPFFIDLRSFKENNDKRDSHNQLPITYFIEKDRIKVIYIPFYSGIYQISIITNGAHLLGSPFPVSVFENTSQIVDNLKEVNFETNKKVVSKKLITKILDLIDIRITKEATTTTTILEEDEDIEAIQSVDNSVCEKIKPASPICKDHIEYEDVSSSKSSLTPLENQKKDNEKLTNPKKHHVYIYGSTKDTNEKSENGKLDVNKENSKNLEYPNSLNILNYLSHLTKNSSHKEVKKSLSDIPKNKSICHLLLEDSYRKSFKEKLTFWENRRNKRTLHQTLSLPDLYSKHKFEEQCTRFPNIILIEQSNTNEDTDTDEYVIYMEFRNKFKRCLEFWEKLSSQMGDCKVSEKNEFNDRCPHIHMSLMLPEEYIYESFDYELFKERQRFWETLSSRGLKEKQYKISKNEESLNIYAEVNTVNNKQFLMERRHSESNLTDDFKVLNSLRDTVKLRFYESKNYFKSLENII
ncbi:hypothetical protein FQA39_LY02784 [Lamprigera yunnana]|nr:hypothetical protein FQA39_LY02784 [Lamprigera yunnana]